MTVFGPVAALLGVLVGFAEPGKQPGAPDLAPSKPFPPADARLRQGDKDPPEVVDLLRQRREVVRAELEHARRLIGDPNFRADAWAGLAERLLVAENDMATSPAGRLEAYRNFRDNLKQMEDRLKDVAQPFRGQGYFEYGQKLWIEARRLQSEVSLLRAETALGVSPPAADSPQVRTALLAWRDAVQRWAKMWLESRVVLIPPFAREIATTALAADLAAANDKVETVAAHRAYRDRLLAVEKDLKAEVEKRRYNAFDYLRVKEMRCDADVALGRLEAGESGGDRLPREVQAALDDWRETIGFEADVIRRRFEHGKTPPEEELPVDESRLHADLAAATTKEQRIAAYRKYLDRLKDAEASLKGRPAERAAPKEVVARVSYDRAAAELTLLQLTSPPASDGSAKVLLTAQRDILRGELAQRMANWTAGMGDLQLLQESAGNLLIAELATASTPAERLRAYEAHAARMRKAEADAKELVQAKKGTDAWLWWTRCASLEAEVWLLRARRNLAAEKDASQPDVR